MVQKVMWWGAVAVVALAALEMGPVESYALVLMLLGLVSGFMYPIEDVTTRVGYYILAVLLPGIADAGGERSVMGDGVLMDIPVAGPFLHGFLVNFALVIAGVAIASFLLVLYKGLMAAGDDSDDGAAEPEAADEARDEGAHTRQNTRSQRAHSRPPTTTSCHLPYRVC